MYEQYLNQSRVAQYRQDRMEEGAVERSLRAMRKEQGKRQEQQEPVVALPRTPIVRRAWQALYSFVVSLL